MKSKDPAEREIAALDAYDGDDAWDGLDECVDALSKKKPSAARMDALLRVFERCPEVDGEELKSVVHALEKMAGYEPRLIASMKRAPSVYAARMFNRMLNAGTKTVGKVKLMALLQETASRGDTPDGVREEIHDILEHHDVKPKAAPAAKKPAQKGSPSRGLLSFGPLLARTADDPVLIAAIKALGGTARVKPSDERGFVSIKKAGVELAFTKKSVLDGDPGAHKGPYVLTQAGVYADGESGYKQFVGELPNKLAFGTTRADVRKVMGKPEESGGGGAFGPLKFKEWDRYRLEKKYLVDFSYHPETNGLGLVDIRLARLEKKEEPRRGNKGTKGSGVNYYSTIFVCRQF
ncbi:MAG: hypothetical protein HYX68_15790 [Planctomycetes bacterium]|nr:hypothetical protein [Planctomycetota bacterium]